MRTRPKVGMRVDAGGLGPATVVYSKSKHSVLEYQRYILVRLDDRQDGRQYGWVGRTSALVPDDAQHLRAETNLLWVTKNHLSPEELKLDFEVDV